MKKFLSLLLVLLIAFSCIYVFAEGQQDTDTTTDVPFENQAPIKIAIAAIAAVVIGSVISAPIIISKKRGNSNDF